MQASLVRRALGVLCIPLVFTACESIGDLDDLEVINQNDPDAERVFRTPGDIENLIAGSYQAYQLGAYTALPLILSAGADETTISWGNFGLKDFSSEPRVEWNNAAAYGSGFTTEWGWNFAYSALSAVHDGFRALDADPTLGDAINETRIRAFGRLVQGLALGWLATAYDSAFVLDETADLETDELIMLPYPNVLEAAIGFLDEAITLAGQMSVQLEASWINGNSDIDGARLAEIANSHVARFMSQVARTPAEAAGATVDWAAIANRIDAGITTDFGYLGNGGNWRHRPIWYGSRPGSSTWQRADYKTIGYTEVGLGLGYDAWLTTPVQARNEFDLDIPDRRITPGPPPHTRGDAGLYFFYRGNSNFPAARGTYHHSKYLNARWPEYSVSGGITFTPTMTVVGMQLLKAESLWRRTLTGAAAIVNNTRVGNGQLTAAADTDADIDEKLFYEMQIERNVYCAGCAFFLRRRAGPIATGNAHHFGMLVGTQLHFAPPGKELDVLNRLGYTYGGVGGDPGQTLVLSSDPPCIGPGCGGVSPSAAAVAPVTGIAGSRAAASVVYRDPVELGRDGTSARRSVRSLSRYH